MTTERDEKRRRRKIRTDKTKTERFPTKVGKLNNKGKTKRKQKGFRLKSETLIIKKRQNENRKVSD